MIDIKVDTSGIKALEARLVGQQKQVRFAAAVALTKTAGKIREALPAELERTLDRPTPFTKRGTYLRAARRDDLRAEVGFMDRQASYLKYQIEGGQRQPGARGIKLPGNITLNSFGNIPKGVIDQLKAAAKGGALSSAIGRRLQAGGNRRKGAKPVELFLGKPQGKAWANAPFGIWRRVEGQPGNLVPVIVFAQKPVHYRPRLNLRKFAEAIVAKEFAGQFAAALQNALATAR